MVNDYITIDLVNREITPIVDVVQSDTGRNLYINTGFKYQSGDQAFAYVLKGDGKKVFNDASIDENGVVTVTWSEQMLAAAGESELQIEITRGARRVSSFPIQVYVSPSIIDEGAIPSTDEFGALETAIANAQAATNEANVAAEYANFEGREAFIQSSNANRAAAGATAAAASANAGATAANNAAASANAGATAANEAATSANLAAAVANTASAYIRTEELPFELGNIEAWTSGSTSTLIQKATKTGNIITIDVHGKVTAAVSDWGDIFGAQAAFNALPVSWRKNINDQIYLSVYTNARLNGQLYINSTKDSAGIMTSTGAWWTRLGTTSNAIEIPAGAEINIHGSWVVENLIEFPDQIVGLNVDYQNNSFTRLGLAVGKAPGEDFDAFYCYSGRRRCNVADDGTILAYYGDENYKEDGSNGQVMVFQPKFYYKVEAVSTEAQSTGIGYHLRNANYYVSDYRYDGFKVHPAFIDKNGNEIDYVLIGAYEACLYDNSARTYITDDAQIMDTATDKLSSIANVKPASGSTQNLTRPNVETLAQNRGSNWHGSTVKIASMNQLLCMIEMGTANFQSAIGQGVVSYASGSGNEASNTGATSSLGNGTGQATQTTHISSDGTETIDTTSGKLSVSYRGLENPWGNIWEFEYGVNIWGNGSMAGGEPYVADDFNFAESKRTDNYEGAGFTVTNANGHISAIGYSTRCDWLFMASETAGNSFLPVGDYTYVTPNLNAYRIALLGGLWNSGSHAGGFCWTLYAGVGYRTRTYGGRLVYVPTKNV